MKKHIDFTSVLVICQTLILTFPLCAGQGLDPPPYVTPLLTGCKDSVTDLVLIADAGTSERQFLQKQLNILTIIVDLFSPSTGDELSTLRVSLLVSEVHHRNESQTTRSLNQVFGLDELRSKHAVKQAVTTASSKVASLSFAKFSPESMYVYVDEMKANQSFRDNATVHIFYMVGSRRALTYYIPDSDTFREANWHPIVMNEDKLMYGSVEVLFRDTVVIFSYWMADTDQIIPLTICGLCGDGWTMFRHPDSELQREKVSCYRLVATPSTQKTVSNAIDVCQKDFAGLPASIETRSELEFLSENVEDMYKSIGSSEQHYLEVIIGLQRMRNSTHQRFRWQNGFPLTYSHWTPSYPKYGFIAGCVVWYFHLNASEEANTFHGQMKESSNAWRDISCGMASDALVLCEKQVTFSPHGIFEANITHNLMLFHDDYALNKVLSRGSFKLCPYVLISLAIRLLPDQEGDCLAEFPYLERTPESQMNWPYFDCLDNRQVSYAVVCDGQSNCLNGRDELYCASVCRFDWFKCTSGGCIRPEEVCDLYNDCADGSDELNCQSCPSPLCEDGRCLPQHYMYDSQVDCSKAFYSTDSKELELMTNASHCVFTCNRTKCVTYAMMGDGQVDCLGPEGPIDETIGRLETATCHFPNGEITTEWAPKCIYVEDRFGALIGCRHLDHLKNCENFNCPIGFVKCPQSYCIPTNAVKDGVIDCALGEDEILAIPLFGGFQCYGHMIMLSFDLVCDGVANCPLKDDELDCVTTCSAGFHCRMGAVFASDYDKSKPLESLAFVPSTTKYLDLSGIDLSQCFNDLFGENLNKLVDVRLSGCKITMPFQYSANFITGKEIAWLDLSYNEIKTIDRLSWISDMENLRSLNLSHNYELLSLDMFPTSLGNLRVLDLSYTSLKSLPTCLDELTIESIDLRHTPLKQLWTTAQGMHFLAVGDLDLRDTEIKDVKPELYVGMEVRNNLYVDNYKLCCPQIRISGYKEIPSFVCQSTADPLSSCENLLGEDVLRILLWIIGGFTVLVNALVIGFRLGGSAEAFKRPHIFFITHLGASDLLMGVYLLIIAGIDLKYQGSYVWHESNWRSGNLCKASWFLSTMSSEVSAFFVLFITLDRYLAIKYPFGDRRISLKATYFMSFMAWTVGAVIAAIPLLPMLDHWKVFSSNGMCIGLPITNEREPGWEYSTAIFIFFNFALFCLIAVGQYLIYDSMESSRSRIELTDMSKRRLQDLKVARNLFLVAFTDLCCWIPIGVLGLMALRGYFVGPDVYRWFAVLVLPINSAINPVIYTIPQLKEKGKILLTRILAHWEKK